MVFYESLMAPVLGTSKLEPEPFKTERHDNDVNMNDVRENVNDYYIHYALNALLERYNTDQQPRDEQELRSLFVNVHQRLKDAGGLHQENQQQLEAAAAASTDVVLLQIMHQVFDLHADGLDRSNNNNQSSAVNVSGEQAPAGVPDDETSSVASSASSSNPSSSNLPSLAASSSRQQRQTRPFKCTVCDKEFGYKHVLQNHERTHTGEKPFVCSVCKKCFTRDHHLKTHVRLHTGEKPFWCPHCNRFFVQVANLRRHLKTHTGESSYPCEYCVAFFESAAELKDHKRQHKENSKPRGASNRPDGGAQKRRRGANKELADAQQISSWSPVAADAQQISSWSPVAADAQQFSSWSPVAHGSPPPSPLPSAASSYWSSPPPQPQTAYGQQYHRQPPAVSPTAIAQQPPPIEPYHYLQFIARFQSPERANDPYGNAAGGKFQSPEQTEPEDLSVKTSRAAVTVVDTMIVDVPRVEQPVDLAMDLTCK